MNRQLSAERTRRAVITESEGARQSAINVAEGQKQSEILKAEGDRQAAILRAEGFSQALERIFAAASAVDSKTMALQYLEALKAIGASPSTKYVIPTEFTRFAEQVGGYVSEGLARDAARRRTGRPWRAAAVAPPAAARRLVIRRALVAVAAPLIAVAAIRPLTDGMARRLMAAPRTGPGRGRHPGAARGARRRGRAPPGPRRRAAGRPLAARRARRGRRLDARPARGRPAAPRLDGLRCAGPRRARAVPAPDGERAGPRLPRPRRLGRRPDDVRRARGRGRRRRAGLARRAGRPPGRAHGLVDGRGHGAGVRRRARGRPAGRRRFRCRRAGRDRRGAAAPDRGDRRASPCRPSSRSSSRAGCRCRSGVASPTGRSGGSARTAGADPRATQPARTVPLLEDVPLLLIHGDADATVPLRDARRLAALAPAGTRHLVVAGADHGAGPCGRPGRVRGRGHGSSPRRRSR